MSKTQFKLNKAHQLIEPLASELKLSWAQVDALRAMVSDAQNGVRRVYADMAMGSGKTAIELAYMEACFRANEDIQGIILTNGQDDVLNILEKEAPIWAPRLYKSGKLSHYTPSKGKNSPFIVATYSSGAEALKNDLIETPDFIYLDEAHGALSELRNGLLGNLPNSVQLFALTATPAYSYRKSLENLGYKESYRLPFEVAIARSLLSSYRNILLKVEDPELKIDSIEIVNGDYNPLQIEKLMRDHSVMQAVKDFIRYWRHPETGQTFFERKGVISCCSVIHAAYTAQELNKEFAHEMADGFNFAEPIWSSSKFAGAMSRDDRNAIITRHRSGHTRFITTKNLLLTGHDDKKIDTVLNLRPTASMVLVPQRGGRAVRFDHENPDKEAWIIDVVLQSELYSQRLFADYAGSSLIETLARQKWRLRNTGSGGPGKTYAQLNPAENIPAPYKVYFDQREIRSYIMTREKRQAIANKPWIASITPTLQDIIIAKNIPSIDWIVREVGRFATKVQWDEDATKSRGQHGNLSRAAILKALTGGFIAERKKQNKDYYEGVAKKWKAAVKKRTESFQREQMKQVNELNRDIAKLDEDMRKPFIHTYSAAEVAISAVLGQHAARLFADIKTAKESRLERNGFDTKKDNNGNTIQIIPEGHTELRSKAPDLHSHQPDHMVSMDYAVKDMVASDHIQNNFDDLIHAAIWDPIIEHDAQNPDNPILPTLSSRDKEDLVREVITEVLATDMNGDTISVGQEKILRRHYQRVSKPKELNWVDDGGYSIPTNCDAFENAMRGYLSPLRLTEQDTDAYMREQDIQHQVHRALTTITAREERVLRMRYGIGSDDLVLENGWAETLDNIGEVFGVSRERVRQMEIKAMQKFKHPSRAGTLRKLL